MLSSQALSINFIVLCALARAVGANWGEAQVEWLRSKGGYFDERLEFRVNPLDVKSPMGMFTTEAIPRGQTLMILPRKCLLTAGPGSTNVCKTTRNLIKEYHLGNESEYAPYVQYIFSRERRQLPSAWSKEGKSILYDIMGKELPPGKSISSVSFKKACDGNGDQFEEDAYHILVSRSWDDKLVPVYDMINHRNGNWSNLDTNSIHGLRDIFVFTSRDIAAGEQLYFGYNECTDCQGYELNYVTQHMIKDFGFVEQFPQRWMFELMPKIVYDLDEIDPPTPYDMHLNVTWRVGDPQAYQISMLLGHLKRLKGIETSIVERTDKLISSHERDLSRTFLFATMTALDAAIQKFLDIDKGTAEADCTDQEESCSAVQELFDDLEEKPDPLTYETYICGAKAKSGAGYVQKRYEHIDRIQSHYQKMDFHYDEDTDDTCLFINNWLQACTSFRAHYHEVFVHYPARFLDQVKRVIYLGGGDNMILHEILKYPSLELVVGMELDQQVVRGSFKNMGIQPHFDDERVQWWFGDATKSLMLLPRELYGTFDLVLLDLQTDVVNILDVTDGMSIVDVASLLVSPTGVIAKNEDFVPRKADDFADYIVDLHESDVPLLCEQAITIGSDAVDFLRVEPKDHKLEKNVWLHTDGYPFERWYNYGRNQTRQNRVCTKDLEEDKKDDTATMTAMKKRLGILLVLEVENVATLFFENNNVREATMKAIESVGLGSTASLKLSDKSVSGNSLYILLKEGYVVVRSYPDRQYCGIDIKLWSQVESLDPLRKALLAAIGDSSQSSLRLGATGMYGLEDNTDGVGPPTPKSCSEMEKPVHTVTTNSNVVTSAATQISSLVPDPIDKLLVVCNDKASCPTLEALTASEVKDKTVASVGCAESESMELCKERFFAGLHSQLGGLKIGVVIVDPTVQKRTGQVLFSLFSRAQVRRDLLHEKYSVLSISSDSTQSWRKNLMERFRTELSMFKPSIRSEILFKDTDTKSDTVVIDIFSSGDELFYSNLVQYVERIESSSGELTKGEVRSVKDGILNYVADFEASLPTKHSDFDTVDSLKQWDSQESLGRQTLFQFEVVPAKLPVKPQDEVLILHDNYWRRGSVIGKRFKSSGTYPVKFDDPNYKNTKVGRDMLIRVDGDTKSMDPLSLEQVREAVAQSLRSVASKASIQKVQSTGDGCIIVAQWSKGSLIASWDGRLNLDVNVYAKSGFTRSAFKAEMEDRIKRLVTIAQDDHPRGVGRVVNFDTEEDSPHWAATK